MKYVCTICTREVWSHQKLLKHYSTVHENKPNFWVMCGINGCLKKYDKVDSMIKHVKRKHTEVLLDQEQNEMQEIENLPENKDDIEVVDSSSRACSKSQFNETFR